MKIIAALWVVVACVLIGSSSGASAATPPYISEFVCNNTAGPVDEFGTKPDWLEIHNPDSVAVNLLGYYLTDNAAKPRKWAFPSYSLGANARLVVFASNRNLTNGIYPHYFHTNFKLSDNGGYLGLTKDNADLTNSIISEYINYPLQFRDVAYGVPSGGGAPFYLNSTTPGTPNSTAKTVLGPLIYNPTTQPPRPTGNATSPAMLITAEVKKSINTVASVRVAWRVMFGAETLVTMTDTGTNGDAVAGDGIYSALIPTNSLTEGQMIRWRIIATDSVGAVSTEPPYSVPTDSDQYFGTVAQDSRILTGLTVFHTFVQDTVNIDNGTGTRVSVFYKGEFYDNVYASIHGQSTSGFPKKSNGYNFNADHSCQFWDNQNRVKGINLMSNYADKSKVRNAMGYEFLNAAGATSNLCVPVRVERNAAFYNVADALEQGDEVWLERVGRDPDGALYKSYNNLSSSANGTNSGVEKKTRKTEPNTDLDGLINGLNESLPIDTRRIYTYDNVDLPSCVSYFAGLAIVSSQDHGHKNFYIYRDTNRTGEWSLFPQDEDLCFGRDWTGGYFDDTMYTTNVLNFVYNYNGTNRLYNILHTSPEFKKMYMRRLRTIMDTILQPPGTSSANGIIEARIRAYLDMIDPPAIGTSDADMDYANWPKWGNQFAPRAEAQRIIDSHLPGRRAFLFTDPSAVLNTSPATSPQTAAEPIPAAQPPHAAITLESFDSNPASGNQDQEYIILKNANAFAVDISGWTVTGGIQFKFKPGTVIPSGGGTTQNVGFLHLAKNPAAFRARTTGPRSGQFCFVTGPYDGQMSGRGDTVNLYDDTGTLISSKTIPPSPTQAQLYLRITEVMYAPSNPSSAELAVIPGAVASDFEYIELTNLGPATLDLSGASLSTAVDFVFPASFTLGAGARTVVTGNYIAFRQRYGNFPPVAGQFTGNLDNSGETIVLTDKAGELVEQFTYDPAWHPLTSGTGYSLVARTPATTPYDGYGSPIAWAVSGPANGTPGVGDAYFTQTFESWRHDYFTPAEELNANLAGYSADPDNDGKSNSIEYQMGGDPKTADALPLAAWQSVALAGSSYGAIKFNRRAHAYDLHLVVEAAVDAQMSAWVAAGTQFGSAVQNANGTEAVVFRDDVTLDQQRRVLRVRDTITGAFFIAQVPQSITFPAIADMPYTTSQLPLSATANSTLPVTFAVTSGPAAITGSMMTVTSTGTVTITASQAGNAGFFPAPDVVLSFSVFKTDQTIDFPVLSDRVYTPVAIPLNAHATSGLPLSFTVTGPATVANGSLTLADVGAVTVKASQGGDNSYSAATDVAWSFLVSKAPQTINFPTVAGKHYLDPAFAILAESNAQLPVSLTRISGPGTLDGNLLTATGAGTIVIEASQAGDSRYDAAVALRQSFVIDKAVPAISWPQLGSVQALTVLSAAQLNATLDSPAGLAGTIVYTPPAGTVLHRGNTSLSVQFVPTDSANFETVTKSNSIVVDRVPVTLAWSKPADVPAGTVLGAAQLNASVTSPAGLTGTFTYSPPAGTVVYKNDSLALSVTFSVDNSDDYETASAAASLTAFKASAPITWPQPADVLAGTVLGALQLNASSIVAGQFVYTPSAGIVLQRNDALQLSVEFTPADTDSFFTTTQTTAIKVLNVAPSVDSPPALVPGATVAGTPLALTAQASDYENDTLTYTWDFGDGGTGAGASPSHTYANAGDYTATLTVTDGNGGSTTSTVVVHVNRALAIASAGAALNFANPGLDKITVKGTMQIPAGMFVGNKIVRTDIGGMVVDTQLDIKGKGKGANVALSIAYPKNGSSKFTLTWQKSSFPLGAAGFVNATVKNKPASLPLLMTVGTEGYQVSVPMSYSATLMKKGTGKFVRPK